MVLTNTELLAGIIAAGGVLIVAALTLIGVAVAWLILDYREDRQYQARHGDTIAWPALLPPPRTPWDRPHPGWDVSPLTRGEIQVAVILRVVDMIAVPQLQPQWVAHAMAICEREAGILWMAGGIGGCGPG